MSPKADSHECFALLVNQSDQMVTNRITAQWRVTRFAELAFSFGTRTRPD